MTRSFRSRATKRACCAASKPWARRLRRSMLCKAAMLREIARKIDVPKSMPPDRRSIVNMRRSMTPFKFGTTPRSSCRFENEAGVTIGAGREPSSCANLSAISMSWQILGEGQLWAPLHSQALPFRRWADTGGHSADVSECRAISLPGRRQDIGSGGGAAYSRASSTVAERRAVRR